MALPAGWPPPVADGIRSIRFYAAATSTADFVDNAFLFIDGVGANTFTSTPYDPPGYQGTTVFPTTPMGTGQNANLAHNGAAVPKAAIWAHGIRIANTGAHTVEFSFDGTNVHGAVAAGKEAVYQYRFEAGIAIRGAGGTGTFTVEAW